MVFSGMNLFQHSTHPRLIRPHDDEQVFTEKTYFCACINDFYVGEVLFIGAYFVLAFHNKHTMITKYTMGFPPTFFIDFQHCCVPFPATFLGFLISIRVMVTECVVCSCTCFNRIAIPEKSLHVRRIKYNTIKRLILVGQITAVNSVSDIRWVKVVIICINLPPEDAFSEGNVSNFRPLWDMKPQHIWKDVCIVAHIS